jgi:hypothetical protein
MYQVHINIQFEIEIDKMETWRFGMPRRNVAFKTLDVVELDELMRPQPDTVRLAPTKVLEADVGRHTRLTFEVRATGSLNLKERNLFFRFGQKFFCRHLTGLHTASPPPPQR